MPLLVVNDHEYEENFQQFKTLFMNDILRLGLVSDNIDFEGFFKLKVFIPIDGLGERISLKEIIKSFSTKEAASFNEFYYRDDGEESSQISQLPTIQV